MVVYQLSLKPGVPLVPLFARPATWHERHARILATPARETPRRLTPLHPVVTGPSRSIHLAAGLGNDKLLLFQRSAQFAVRE